MKRHYTLNCACEYDFLVFAINSHIKSYKLCWNLNQSLGLNFEIKDSHKIKETLEFTRYESKNSDGVYFNLIVNRSKRGYMIPSNKSINYFLIINKNKLVVKKDEILIKLREINDILLVFEFLLEKEKNSDRFIIYDKKN